MKYGTVLALCYLMGFRSKSHEFPLQIHAQMVGGGARTRCWSPRNLAQGSLSTCGSSQHSSPIPALHLFLPGTGPPLPFPQLWIPIQLNHLDMSLSVSWCSWFPGVLFAPSLLFCSPPSLSSHDAVQSAGHVQSGLFLIPLLPSPSYLQ